MSEFETRIIKVVVLPKNESIYSEQATAIEIVDEAAGEFVKITQEGGDRDYAKSICFSPDEWPSVRAAINEMILKCRGEKVD